MNPLDKVREAGPHDDHHNYTARVVAGLLKKLENI